jgi:DNA-binding FadR family transcriptional regulator
VTASIARTRAESLAADIEARISEQALAPGSPFGTLDDLRAESKFARSTVSEAVRLLSDRGVLEVRPGRGGGLFVAQTSPVVRLRHMLLRVREKPTPVADAIAVRDALESLIDVDAARHRTAPDVADLKNLVKEMKRSGADPETYMASNWALHERIAEITPNNLASATYLGTTRYIADSAERVESDDEVGDYLQKRIDLHVELVEAIIAGDVERTAAAAARHNSAI